MSPYIYKGCEITPCVCKECEPIHGMHNGCEIIPVMCEGCEITPGVCMSRLAGVEFGDVVADPLCGGGTISIEVR